MSEVLIVDDERVARRIMERILEPAGYGVSQAGSAGEARELLAAMSFPLVLLDIRMPGESGLDLAAFIHAEHPDTAIVMTSGQDDPAVAALASERGAFGYLVKPFSANELVIGVQSALRRRSAELENRTYRARLEAEVAARTADLEQALTDLAHTRAEIIRRLTRAVEHRDLDTGMHVERIGELSALLAHHAGLAPERIALLRLAAPMHDVGKVGIPDAILSKPGRLTAEERADMERHTTIGRDVLAGSGIELLEVAATVAWTHHEHFDGGGYPRGLDDDRIPVEGRIVAVADVYDALTNDRVYRPALPVDEAVSIMEAGRGTHFDPDLLGTFFDHLDEARSIATAVDARRLV